MRERRLQGRLRRHHPRQARRCLSGQRPVDVAIIDLNVDANPDVVVSNAAGVNVMLGQGDGSINAAIAYAAGRLPRGLAFQDFNNDGRVDVVVANEGDSTTSVLLEAGAARSASRLLIPPRPARDT